ncbi:MAG: nitronate monooxygenase family protein [Proteobacteria bacterium]|nr:nitronate monooxygenase family protein [Pseudomonadota bacterium]MBU1389848.1 nitronate monooxygenase family protein [Pseudomonadota bacterium]MBU1543857.1 nitronate monooxygenase family protein [Pseudomonadota bacterium]MBU2481106.1 nitronate monooxygenase family protein [Pseudomonadota bacterium]
MLTTRITRLLGIEYPVIGGTMMSISNARFVAAISNAGGLGILASAIYQTKQDFSAAVDQVLKLTDRPFAVNLNLFPSMRPIDNTEYLDVMIEKGVKIVETSGHSAPEDLCRRFKDAGMIWIHKCVGIRYALKVEKMGADIVTVVGYENGGATGKLDIGTLVLIPGVVDAVNLPVIGGGGISDGRGLAAVLALGAEAAIIGTRLMLTKECSIHDNLKQALMQASEQETVLIMRSIGSTHRVWNNEAARKCMEIERTNGSFEEVLSVVTGQKARLMYDTGDITAGVVSCGQGIGLCHDIPTVKQLFDRLIKEAQGIFSRFA